MKANPVLLGLFSCLTNAVAQKGLQCFVPGECLDSQILGATPTNNSRECWRHCQSTTGCTWFTFYEDSQVCTPLSGCLRLSNKKCQDNCISGEEECPEVQCGVHGRCYGALEGIRKVANAKECATICRHREECFWNTYDPEHESCLMTNDCPLLDRSCSNCSSSERDCFGETHANTNTKNEDNSKARKNLVFGTFPAEAKQIFFNLETKTTEKCELPVPIFSKNAQYTMVSNDLLACSEGIVNNSTAITFYKFDIAKKAWVFVDSWMQNIDKVLYILPVPDKGILILTESKFIYLFNGRKILHVTDGFSYPSDRYQNLFCLTAVSTEEILVGSNPRSKNGEKTLDLQLYSMNMTDRAFIPIELPKLELMNSACGAFGPQGNRKVVIFGGNHHNDSQNADFNDNPNLDKIIILDWNSKTIEQQHGTYFDKSTFDWQFQTFGYGDTFVLRGNEMPYTNIFEFDAEETINPFVFLGKIPYCPLRLAEISWNMVTCE